ncbi:MAG: hypothetical protein Q9211_000850 [Gyalolechia sp. 1 TL-2023]
MGPRKRSKPNPQPEEERDLKPESGVGTASQLSVTPSSNIPTKPKEDADRRRDITPRASKAWYGGGTWRRGSKAMPVTQVAKETILAATDKATEFLSNAQNPTAQAVANPMTSPSIYLSRSLRLSNKSSSPADHTPKPDVVNESLNRTHEASPQPAPSSVGPDQAGIPVSNLRDLEEKPPPEPDPPGMSTPKNLESQEGTANIESLPWRAWFSRNGNTAKPEPPKPEPSKPPDAVSQSVPDEPESPARRRNSDPSAASSNITQDPLPRSWLGLWLARSAKAGSADGATIAAAASIDRPLSSSVPATPNAEDIPVASNTQSSTTKAPGWAFWSREASGDTADVTAQSSKGELVVAESPAQVATASRTLNPTQNNPAKRPVSMEPARKATVPNLAPAQIPSDTPPKGTGKSPQNKTTKTPLIRSVLGQPTGTSIRFADGAATAIQNWTRARGYECTIEKVALEGEGRIIERVNMLWKLLLNWMDNIRQADLVMVACHSQGVPVAIMLIAKLIEFGCIQDARIGVCAMAGVNLGPFLDFKSRWIGGSAGELFDFARSDSQVSKDYTSALTTTLKSGVRITYIGSIDDQLVSLESSTFGTVDHPYIYRAVFVNGSVHAPDFLTHLVGFALKLRNLGISDHGLIRELSSPLAGSLYSGEGHSTIYEDSAVYYLAVQNTLETSAIGDANLGKIREGVPASQNPYILPFSLRGVLEEDYVKNELHEETMELLRQFDEWKPSSKALKDVKFRLEGVRSKL